MGKGSVTGNVDGTYTITPEDGKEKLSANTKIYVADEEAAKIDTSCSSFHLISKIFFSWPKVMTSIRSHYLSGCQEICKLRDEQTVPEAQGFKTKKP